MIATLRFFGLKLAVVFGSMLLLGVSCGAQDQPYYPGVWGDWQARDPAEAGMNGDKLAAAVEFAKQAENSAPRDLAQVIAVSFANEPFHSIVGPTKVRGGANGIVIRNGYVVAEWGDTQRVDMTFSVTKSYLSTVAGLALDDGLIRDVDDPVRIYVRDGRFDSDHNEQLPLGDLDHIHLSQDRLVELRRR